MMKQTLSYFSGFPALLSPNAPAVLKKAKLEEKRTGFYRDRHGRMVEAMGLQPNDYHLYVLASRTSAAFGKYAMWDKHRLTVVTTLIFQTFPTSTEVPVELVFDGSSPYQIPSKLNPGKVAKVSVASPAQGALSMGMTFTHDDGTSSSFCLSPDLLHYVRFPEGYNDYTDFKIEYIGIACGPNGDRNIFDRAYAHEKVVEILGELQQWYGNRSLYIFAYDPGFIISSAGGGQAIMTGPNLITQLVSGGLNSVYEAMEASLISYFQPKYNDEFKNFPKNKPRPKWLKNGSFGSFDSLAVGVNKIQVTLASDSSFNSDGIWSFGRFYSEARKPDTLHFVDIDV
jgi:hypothetical protein